jgi:hypothetical protein
MTKLIQIQVHLYRKRNFSPKRRKDCRSRQESFNNPSISCLCLINILHKQLFVFNLVKLLISPTNKMNPTTRLACIGLLILIQTGVNAQEVTDSVRFSKAIEDNSYFIEEAYNQEDRVVQHINNARLSLLSSHDFAYSFTQEWPVFSQKHQFSYTIGFSSLNSGNVFGFNDVMLNYRYQLTDHDAFITLAPRISLIIPTGNAKKDLGTGIFGYQFNLAASKRISNSFVFHANAGYTLLPNVESTGADNIVYHHTYSIVDLGASAIWLMTYRTNLMLEVLYNIIHEAGESSDMVTYGQAIVSPGIRHAFDLKSLQIVPGIAVPMLIQNNNTL